MLKRSSKREKGKTSQSPGLIKLRLPSHDLVSSNSSSRVGSLKQQGQAEESTEKETSVMSLAMISAGRMDAVSHRSQVTDRSNQSSHILTNYDDMDVVNASLEPQIAGGDDHLNTTLKGLLIGPCDRCYKNSKKPLCSMTRPSCDKCKKEHQRCVYTPRVELVEDKTFAKLVSLSSCFEHR